MSPHTLSEEAFFAAWVGQSAFHRTRLAARAALEVNQTGNDAMKLSLMLDCITQYVQALEDYVIWSGAIRKAVSEHVRLDDALDTVRADWVHVIGALQDGTPQGYRTLWALPEDAADPTEQASYQALLEGWARTGEQIARSLDARTPGGSWLMNRVLNKTKHGLYVSAAYSGDDLYLVFHPEAAGGHYSIQLVSSADANKFALQTYSVSKLLAATLQQVYASWYGVLPDCPWKDTIIRGADEESADGILEIATTAAIPRFANP